MQRSSFSRRLLTAVLGLASLGTVRPGVGSVVRGGMTIPRRKSQRQIRLARRRIGAHTNR